MDFGGLDLDGALNEVLNEAFKDEVPDVLRHKDYVVAWPKERAELLEALKTDTYRPLPATLYEVPKSSLATRPIAILHMRDRILYQAIMHELAPHIDSHLTEEVWSSRLVETKSGKRRVLKQTKAWGRFQRRGRELCEEYEDVCLLTTDVTSYFEFVDLNRLARMLGQVPGVNLEQVSCLLELLRGITGNMTNLHGIPQGPEVSSFLGNLYLSPLDATLRRLGLKFIRFQDDLKVFASEPHILRRAVLDLMPVVREQHLNLSTGKTEILTGDAVLEHFEDARKDALQYGIDVGDAGIEGDIQEFFDGAVAGQVRPRDVKFAVHRLQKLGDPHAVPWIFDHLAEVPYLASLLVRYLSVYLDNDTLAIEKRVCDFLEDARLNISPWVELHLIRMFARAHTISERTYDIIWKTLRDQNRDSRVRQFAARCLGRHLRPRDNELLLAHYKTAADDLALKRALLVALKESGVIGAAELRAVEASDPYSAHCALLAQHVLPPRALNSGRREENLCRSSCSGVTRKTSDTRTQSTRPQSTSQVRREPRIVSATRCAADRSISSGTCM